MFKIAKWALLATAAYWAGNKYLDLLAENRVLKKQLSEKQ